MSNKPTGDLMELREMREGCCFYLLRGQACFREVRRTFSAQGFDAALFHFQMKQKPVGASTIAEGLQGGDVGASQGHRAYGEIEYLTVRFEDVE